MFVEGDRMKILILHLSDIHISGENSFSSENIMMMINALRTSMRDISKIIIIISGDVSYSGKDEQFKEFNKFLKELTNKIDSTFGSKNIEVLLVPGNHDVDYTKDPLSRNDLEDIFKQNKYDNEIKNEINKQEAFYKCANKYGCYKKRVLVDKYKTICDNKIILFNLINTAVFSSLDEDQGYHYLRKSDMAMIKNQENADYVFSVMHHPHQWFSSMVSDEFEEVLYQCSDMIFVGHKHYEKSINIDDSKTSVRVLAGGMLSNCGNWAYSEFHICVLNTSTRNLSIKKYRLNDKNKVYVEVDAVQDVSLSYNRVDCLGLTVLPESMKKLICVDKHSIADSFIKYFVFPSLEEDVINASSNVKVHDISTSDSFFKRLSEIKKVIITGHSDAGKTVLAKYVFQHIAKNKTTLFIDGKNVCSNNDYERVIRYAFEELYGFDKEKYELFKQGDLKAKAIIVDDIDAVNSSYREGFVEYLNNNFGYIALTCQQEIELDIKNRLRNKKTNKDYYIYKIAPFYLHKRRELVTNIINILSNKSSESNEEIIATLCDALSRQKLLYNWNPDFIVQFTRYYYNNIGESYKNDGDTFSKVFEANIVLLIKPFAGNMSVDKILIVLDKIAYESYLKKESPISHESVSSTIKKYNDEYDANIDVRTFLNLLIDSKIIKTYSNGEYLFYEPMYLAYFTARELKRRCIEDGDLDQIKYVIEHAYKRINADILLFVTYITDNLNIIKMIMSLAETAIDKWEDFNLESIKVNYLATDTQFKIKPVVEKDREKEERDRIEAEKNEARYMAEKNEESIFDDNEEINFFHELIRAIALLTVLSRTLPSFEHLMKKMDKERCVNLIYTIPLRIFNTWATEIDRNCTDIIREIKEFHEWEYRKDKPREKELTDDRAINFLQWESISLLLELMNVAISNAVRNNTWKFIDNYDFNNRMSYRIEHLMGLGKQDKIDKFISEAERLMKVSPNQLGESMTKRVVRNFMVTSKKIKHDQTQKLNAKIFNAGLEGKNILLEKNRNRKKY